MRRSARDGIFDSTIALRVLSFLLNYPSREFLASEIQKKKVASRAGIYLALQQLNQKGFVRREARGRFHLYAASSDNPVIKQYKALKNVISLEPLLDKLRRDSLKIVLFGSSARGEDFSTSDFDLLILAREVERMRALVASFKGERRIQTIILSPTEFSELKEKDQYLFSEIDRGIVLWEAPA